MPGSPRKESLNPIFCCKLGSDLYIYCREAGNADRFSDTVVYFLCTHVQIGTYVHWCSHTHTFLHLCIQVHCGCLSALMSWHMDLGGHVHGALPARPAGNREGGWGQAQEPPGSRAAGDGGGGGQALSPGFIKRAVMNPLGRSSPHAHHSRSLLVQREAFDSHRQLSDGTKSLHTPLFLRPPSLCPHIFALPSSLRFSPPPSHPLSLSIEKYNSQRAPPLVGFSHGKESCVLWA